MRAVSWLGASDDAAAVLGSDSGAAAGILIPTRGSSEVMASGDRSVDVDPKSEDNAGEVARDAGQIGADFDSIDFVSSAGKAGADISDT